MAYLTPGMARSFLKQGRKIFSKEQAVRDAFKEVLRDEPKLTEDEILDALYSLKGGGSRKVFSSPDLAMALSDPKVKKAYVFGSGVKGGKENPSDIDILEKRYGFSEPKYDIARDRLEREGVNFLPTTGEGQGAFQNALQTYLVGLGKYGPKHRWTRIAGATGAGAIAKEAADPGEADASMGQAFKGLWTNIKSAMRSMSPVGEKMRKTKSKEPIESSANEVLKGKQFRGSTIKGVYQGIGDERFLHMSDGRIYPMKQKDVHELSAEFGSQKYIEAFKEKPKEAQWQQILNSLDYNRRRSSPPGLGGSKDFRKQLYENYAQNVGGMFEGREKIADQVLVQDIETRRWWLWPKVYAEPAEAAGLVKIDRTFKLRGE